MLKKLQILQKKELFRYQSAIESRIDRLRKNHYLEVSDEDRKTVRDFYFGIEKNKQDGNLTETEYRRLLISFLQNLHKIDDLSDELGNPLSEIDFNVDKHLKKLNARLGNLGQNYIEKYSSDNRGISLNSRNLFRTDMFLSKKAELYTKKALEVLDLFMNGNSKISTELKRLLNNYKIEIKIVNENGCNGSMDFFKKKKKAVLALDKGLFERDRDVLAFMLAHELGHFVDYANRPRESTCYVHQVSEECFADVSAAILTNQAGFNLAKVVDLFNEISKDPKYKDDMNHPKIKDRIAAIKATNLVLVYQQQVNRTYNLIKKTQSLLMHKSKKNNLCENLDILQDCTQASNRNIYSVLKAEQKKMEEDDLPTEEYISKRTADILYKRFAKKYFLSDETFRRGYCTALPLMILKSISPKLSSIIPSDDDPKEFIKQIKQKFPDCIYSSSEEHSLSDILKNEAVSPNAFVIFDLKKQNGSPQENSPFFHTVTFTGYNREGDILCDSFDDEKRSCILKYNRQCGYVIDTYKLFHNILLTDDANCLSARLAKSLLRKKSIC